MNEWLNGWTGKWLNDEWNKGPEVRQSDIITVNNSLQISIYMLYLRIISYLNTYLFKWMSFFKVITFVSEDCCSKYFEHLILYLISE